MNNTTIDLSNDDQENMKTKNGDGNNEKNDDKDNKLPSAEESEKK